MRSFFAYLHTELAKMGIDVATISGIYNRPHGLPGYIPGITYIDPETGTVRVVKPNGNVLRLHSFAVAVVNLQ